MLKAKDILRPKPWMTQGQKTWRSPLKVVIYTCEILLKDCCRHMAM